MKEGILHRFLTLPPTLSQILKEMYTDLDQNVKRPVKKLIFIVILTALLGLGYITLYGSTVGNVSSSSSSGGGEGGGGVKQQAANVSVANDSHGGSYFCTRNATFVITAIIRVLHSNPFCEIRFAHCRYQQ